MSLSDDLEKLGDLHRRGALDDDEFSRAKARVLDGNVRPGDEAPAAMASINALRRSRDDRWIGGVCGGLARSTGLESWAWRLGFTLLAMFGGTGVLVYLLMWIFVPRD